MKLYKSKLIESIATTILLRDELPKITKILEENDISYCLIGGLALGEYNLSRGTDDIDFIILASDKNKFENLVGRYLRPAFSGATRKFYWYGTKLLVEILYTGEITGDGVHGIKIESPDKISSKTSAGNVIKLVKLIEYKLSSGIYGKRIKDLGDVQELIKLNNLKRSLADGFREDLKTKYREIWDMNT